MTRRHDPIRLGIIGCGKVWHERHLPALRHCPNARITAIADLDEDRLHRAATKLNIARRFTDYRELLDRDDIDAVGILTPTESHAEIGIAAIQTGKHVLIEKPLALTLKECDRLGAHGAEASGKIVVCFNLRWHRLMRKARDIVASGTLGDIRAIRSVYTHNRTGEDAPDWHRKLALGGGVAFNEAVHHFDLWRYLLDCEVENVSSFNQPSVHYEDDNHVVSAKLSNGALATAFFTLTTSPNSEVEIFGTAGRLVISCYRFDGLQFFSHSTYPGDISDRLKKTLGTISSLPKAISTMRQGGDFQATFVGIWRHFFDCITNDRESECTLEDGKSALRIALATLESSSTGTPVELGIAGDGEH
jgi:predicted dehydrogenase